jgi:hypothetical protein
MGIWKSFKKSLGTGTKQMFSGLGNSMKSQGKEFIKGSFKEMGRKVKEETKGSWNERKRIKKGLIPRKQKTMLLKGLDSIEEAILEIHPVAAPGTAAANNIDLIQKLRQGIQEDKLKTDQIPGIIRNWRSALGTHFDLWESLLDALS